MSELLNLIRGGIKTTDFFDYDGHTLKIRPVTSMEIDDAKAHGYDYVSPKLAKLIVQISLGKINGTDKLKNVPTELYVNIDKFNREINYWIVYHGMKDFMPDDFSIDDVRKMHHVHKIAAHILSLSSSDKKSIQQIIKTEDGQEVAKAIWHFNIPLVSSIADLTPLQHQFLIWSDPDAPVEIEAVDETLPKFGELIKDVGARD